MSRSGKRRAVLQLNEPSPRQETYGFGFHEPPPPPGPTPNALGLMSQYGESDDDSEEEAVQRPLRRKEASSGVKKMNFVASSEKYDPNAAISASNSAQSSQQGSPVPNGRSHPPPDRPSSPAPVTSKAKDEIDNKVLDFLAEIESISTEDAAPEVGADVDGEPLPAPKVVDEPMSTDESDGDSESKPVEPPVPTTDWQHCLDEGTECYYYWNIATNEVTWEIPMEYSQYLLKLKEHEILEAKYQDELVLWEQMHPPQGRKRKRRSQREKKSVKPDLVSYPSVENSETVEDMAGSSTGCPVIGPQLPPLPPREAEQIGPQLPNMDIETEIGPQLPNMDIKSELLDYGSHFNIKQEPMIDPRPPPPPPPPPEDESLHVIGSNTPERPANENHASTSKVDEEDIDEDDDDFIHRQLEEPVFSHYEYVNKRYVESEHEREESDFDMDDIDLQLEQALEKKQAEIKASSQVGQRPDKQKPVSDICPPGVGLTLAKKPIEDEDVEEDRQRRRLDKLDVKQKVGALAEVADLAALIMDKLDFLDTSRRSLTKLQVLLIEVETRIQDWREGGLMTNHLLQKLRAAGEQLLQYEQSAAPAHWSCHWDREFKRYFYCHDVTEETQWEYPESSLPTAAEPPSDPAPALPPMPESPPPPPLPKHHSHSITPPPLPEHSRSTEAPAYTRRPSGLPFGQDYPLAAPPPPPPPPEEEIPRPPMPPPVPMDSPSAPSPPPLPPDSTESRDRSNSPSTRASTPDSVEMEIDGDPIDTPMYSPSGAVEDLVPTIPESSCDSESAISGKPVHISAPPVIVPPPHPYPPPPSDYTSNPQGIPPPPGDEPHAAATSDASEEPPLPKEVPVATEGGSGTHSSPAPAHSKEKKKKKDKALVGGGLALKKKNVTGLVQKWQKVQREVEHEIEQQKTKFQDA